MQYRLGELFCGPGGIAWGATHADIGNSDYSIVHQWANDYDANTCETYRHNICPDAPQTVYHEDIRKFNMSKLAPIDALLLASPAMIIALSVNRKAWMAYMDHYTLME